MNGKKLAKDKHPSLLGMHIGATRYPLLLTFQMDNPRYTDGKNLLGTNALTY
jgi:hypothetical protein